jgi:hypothetical protein
MEGYKENDWLSRALNFMDNSPNKRLHEEDQCTMSATK